ncbi:MAG: hypothetical protein WCG23_03580 [bacterium]
MLNNNNKIYDVTKELKEELFIQIEIIRSVLLKINTNSADKRVFLEKNEILHEFFRAFHCISGIADFIDLACVKNICIVIELFLNKCKKDLMYKDENLINEMSIIINSIHYIEKICNEPEIQYNDAFRTEMHLFLLTIKNTTRVDDNYEIIS